MGCQRKHLSLSEIENFKLEKILKYLREKYLVWIASLHVICYQEDFFVTKSPKIIMMLIMLDIKFLRKVTLFVFNSKSCFTKCSMEHIWTYSVSHKRWDDRTFPHWDLKWKIVFRQRNSVHLEFHLAGSTVKFSLHDMVHLLRCFWHLIKRSFRDPKINIDFSLWSRQA